MLSDPLEAKIEADLVYRLVALVSFEKIILDTPEIQKHLDVPLCISIHFVSYES
jgi:hypothetical protein